MIIAPPRGVGGERDMNLSMKDMLTMYFGSRHMSKWQRFKISLFLLFRSKQYKNRRTRILLYKAKVRSDALLRKEWSRPTPTWMADIKEADCWKGASMAFPLVDK